MRAKKIIFSVVCIAMLLCTMSLTVANAMNKDDTVSPMGTSTYGPRPQSWNNYTMVAFGQDGYARTQAINNSKVVTKMTAEASRWSIDKKRFYDDSIITYNVPVKVEKLTNNQFTVQVKQDASAQRRYDHSVDVYGSTDTNTVVHTFSDYLIY